MTDADLDPPGPRVLYVNPAFTELTGYGFKELEGRTPRLLQGAETDRRVLDRLRRNLEAGESFEGETINYRKNGSPFVMRWYIEPVRNAEGRITHFFALQRDVTVERQESRQRRLLEQAIGQWVDFVVVFGLDGRASYVNDAYLEWSERRRDDVIGKPIWRLIGAPRQLHELRSLRSGFSRGESRQQEYEIKKGQGPLDRRLLFVTVSPIRGPGDEITELIAVGRDVTEQRRLAAIAEAHNLHSHLGVVFSGIRHELGNPVNSVKTALQVVAGNIDHMPRPKLERYLSGIQEEVERVEYLLRSLRSYNLYDKPRPESIEISGFLEGFLQLARRDAQRLGVEVTVAVEPAVETLWADPQGLHQVLLNLLGNSLAALEGQEGGRIEIQAIREQAQTILSVLDNGPGIPAEHLPYVSKPFYTTRSGGTGLGLSISRYLLAMMGGTLEIRSSSEGTEAIVLLHNKSSKDEKGSQHQP